MNPESSAQFLRTEEALSVTPINCVKMRKSKYGSHLLADYDIVRKQKRQA